MGIFNRNGDFNKKLEEAANIPGAQIVDVRTPEEYQEGHIPSSINAPLAALRQADFVRILPQRCPKRSGLRYTAGGGLSGGKSGRHPVLQGRTRKISITERGGRTGRF